MSEDEKTVMLDFIQSLIDAHPDYTLTSHIGPDGHQYTMIQFFDDEPNHQASSDFVSMVSELDEEDDG